MSFARRAGNGIAATTRTSGETWLVGAAALALAASLAGCGKLKPADGPDGAAPQGGPASGLAVMSTDFTSTSISLLEADGTLAKDDCIDSGTQAAGKLSLALSGDVTLPTQPQAGGGLWLVDSGNAAITIVDPTTCTVSGQFSVATGFQSDPHDVAVVPGNKVYVTRYDKNVKPADAMSTGDDIVILDHDSGAITGRIDMSSYAAPVAGVAIQARPDRMAIVDGKVYVTLGSQDAMFASAGEGRVAVIDPSTDTVTGTIAITGLEQCSAMYYLAATKWLFVACGGSFADADQAAASGVAVIDLSVSPPVVAHVTKGSAFDDEPVTFFWVGALSATRAFTSTDGMLADTANNVPGTNDALFMFDPTAGTATAVGLETGAFDMGRGAVGDGTLFVPDSTAKKPLVHVFDVSGTGAPTETTSFDPEPAKGLAPHEIAWY